VRARSVIPIDYDVKKVLLLYVGRFPTYEKAAEAIGVNRSTIAVYMEGAENISREVLESVVSRLRALVGNADLDAQLGAGWSERILSRARTRNFLHTDHEALALNPGLHRLLDYYTTHFQSRTKAAKSLGVNPRTYKAYVKETISTLPRSVFNDAVRILEEKGRSRADICKACGVSTLDELLASVDRPETVQLDDDGLLDQLIAFHDRGGRSLRQEARPLYNLCQRRHGGTRAATARLMERVTSGAEERLAELLSEGAVDQALGLLTRIEGALRWYSAQLKVVERGRGPSGEPRWREDVMRHVPLVQRLRKRLYRDAAFTHEYMVMDEVEQFRFRHRHLRDFVPYETQGRFDGGELVYHGAFGMGRVLGDGGKNKVRVLFRGGVGEVLLTSTA